MATSSANPANTEAARPSIQQACYDLSYLGMSWLATNRSKSRSDSNHKQSLIFGLGGKGVNDIDYLKSRVGNGTRLFTADITPPAAAISIDTPPPVNSCQLWEHLPDNVFPQPLGDLHGNLSRIVQGVELVYILAGLGGEVSSKDAVTIAQESRQAGALVFVLVSLPFLFEQNTRSLTARRMLDELASHAHACFVQPNEQLISMLGGRAMLTEAFVQQRLWLAHTLTILQGACKTLPVRTAIMEQPNPAQLLLGYGRSRGSKALHEAYLAARDNPLVYGMVTVPCEVLVICVVASTRPSRDAIKEIETLARQDFRSAKRVFVRAWVDQRMGHDSQVTLLVLTPYSLAGLTRLPLARETLHRDEPTMVPARHAGSESDQVDHSPQSMVVPAKDTEHECGYIEGEYVVERSSTARSSVAPVYCDYAPLPSGNTPLFRNAWPSWADAFFSNSEFAMERKRRQLHNKMPMAYRNTLLGRLRYATSGVLFWFLLLALAVAFLINYFGYSPSMIALLSSCCY